MAVPTDFPGLIGWYRANDLILADGAPVVTWPDQSGAGNDLDSPAAAQRPLYRATGWSNGRPAVEFDGVNDELRTPAISLGVFTIIAIIDFRAAAGIITEHGPNAGGPNPGHYFYAGNNESIHVLRGASRSAWNYAAGWGSDDRQRIAASVYDGTHAGTRLHMNRMTPTLIDTAFNANPGVGVVNDQLHIGARSGGCLPSTGFLAELVIYNQARTAAEIFALADEWGPVWNCALAGPAFRSGGSSDFLYGPISSLTLGAPTALDGDTLIAVIGFIEPGITVITPPAGWTTINEALNGEARMGAYFRRLGAGDPRTVAWTTSQPVRLFGGALGAYMDTDAASPVPSSRFATGIYSGLGAGGADFTTPDVPLGRHHTREVALAYLRAEEILNPALSFPLPGTLSNLTSGGVVRHWRTLYDPTIGKQAWVFFAEWPETEGPIAAKHAEQIPTAPIVVGAGGGQALYTSEFTQSPEQGSRRRRRASGTFLSLPR